MITTIVRYLIMCGWCRKQFNPRAGRCPGCQREVVTPRA